MGFTEQEIPRVPQAALDSIDRVCQQRGTNRSAVLNWGLQLLACTYPNKQLYWCPIGTRSVAIPVPLEPVLGRPVSNITVQLSSRAADALRNGQSHFCTTTGFVLGRVARIVPYYGRIDGRFGCGPRKGRGPVPRISKLRMLG